MKQSLKSEVQILFIVPTDTVEYVGVALLSSCLKRNGFKRVLAISYNAPQLNKLIEQARYNVLAFCTFTPFAKKFMQLSRKLKRKHQNIISVFGGPHPQFAPEIIDEEWVDGICFGEGEEALPELLNKYDYEKQQAPLDIRNWWVKDSNNKVFQNDLRPIVTDLDTLPFADLSLFPRSAFFRKGLRRFVFSRGCPFHCRYCLVVGYSNIYNMKPAQYYRVRSVASAIQEIKQALQEYGGSVIGMRDSIFGLDIDWLERFSHVYRREISLPFYCNLEAQVATERHIDLLHKAGCYLIQVGLETGSEHTRNIVLNKQFSNEKFYKIAHWIKNRNMRLGTYNMVGLPQGALQNDLDTLEMNQRVKTDLAECKVFSLYPGIAMYDECKSHGAHPENYKVYQNVYWTVINDREVRKDLPQLMRLHCLFNIFVYWKTPRWLIRILIKLPLRTIYKLFALLLVRTHIHYDRMIKPLHTTGISHGRKCT